MARSSAGRRRGAPLLPLPPLAAAASKTLLLLFSLLLLSAPASRAIQLPDYTIYKHRCVAVWYECRVRRSFAEQTRAPSSGWLCVQFRCSLAFDAPRPPVTRTNRNDLLQEITAIAAANPKTMRLDTRPGRDQSYKVDVLVLTVEPGGLSDAHAHDRVRLLLVRR